MSVTHGQCDARPTVTFPAARHHRPLAGIKLYCLVSGDRGTCLLTTCPELHSTAGQRPTDHNSSVLTSDVNKDLGPKAKAKDTGHKAKAKALGYQGQGLWSQCQGQGQGLEMSKPITKTEGQS